MNLSLRSIRAYGAELIVVEDGVDYMDEANRLAKENGWYDVDQYDNLANTKAHEETMAPELRYGAHRWRGQKSGQCVRTWHEHTVAAQRSGMMLRQSMGRWQSTATLWNATGFKVGRSQALPDSVVVVEVLMKCAVCIEDERGESSCFKEVVEEFALVLVKTFPNVGASPCEVKAKEPG